MVWGWRYNEETVHADMPVEETHWYYPALEPVLDEPLKNHNIAILG
jgi:hypothetical protein